MKPCKHEILVDGCRICWLGANDERYSRLFGTELISEPVFPCIHLGNATKEFVECRSCPKEQKQPVPVHQCAVHGKCAPALDHHLNVKGCRKCSEREPARPVLQTIRVHVPGQPTAFNPSIIDYKGRLLFCYRNRWAGSTLWICELNRQTLQPVNQGKRLTLQHPRCRSGQEDPRLFVFRDRLHIQFSGVETQHKQTIVNVVLAILSDELEVEHVWEPRFPDRMSWEKNWQTFDFDRELYSVYHPFKDGVHHVLSHAADVATMIASERWTPKWSGEIRGGASPVRVSDEYWCFFHGFPRYSAGLYTFDAAPPFRPRRMIPSPLLVPNGGPGKPVIFPCGAVKDGNRWLVAFGRNDQHTEIAVLDHTVLEKLLVRVHAPMNLPNSQSATQLRHQDEYGEIVIPDDQHAPPVYREVCVEDAYGLRHLHASGLDVKTAVDIGASYGVASRMIHKLWPSARVLAFEPDHFRFGYLARNSPQSERSKTAVVGFAGSDRMLAGIGFDGGRWRKDADEALDGIHGSDIQSVTAALAGVEDIDLLKIDVEGFELGIIQEMNETGMLSRTKVIVGEWHFLNSLHGIMDAVRETHEFHYEPANDNPWNLFRCVRLKAY